MRLFDKSLVTLDIDVKDAEEAIRGAGQLLVDSGAAEASYVEAMLAAYREKGPYIVIAPHIALPHAKSESGVHEAAVAFARLKEPVKFGHADNDPVDLVFALGSSSSSDHIKLLRTLSSLLTEPANIAAIRSAGSAEELENLLK
ncbi:PTS sugar transporter subunit IIA [Paenibacillus lactis]|uniref:PTS sugar transporter subunit IIA n=1 Tax=Paenibacillus lactis TaxID=228574 RepID=UPI0011A5C5F6